ncbi:hypothetical protein F0L68_16460 [Solihabitans fulvus]|uniref:Uncharacterized protein n=1 Tax=Solihabitans fulvus TaxID=1892852 RepID=A0A5B2XCC4_9PSEU|nr:hypothetical protein [Solihabitans fulvus]KAA2261388.1 hypothetical protein F0L68_16460 [Solihabitans fulvus]
MGQPVVVFALAIAARIAYLVAAWRTVAVRERARTKGLAAVLRAARPGSVVVSRHADGETLIVLPQAATTEVSR